MTNWSQKLILLMLLIINKLVKKADYNTKIVDFEKKVPVHGKYTTTSEFNKLKKENFDETIKQANLASKNDISEFIKKRILMKN